MRATYTVLIAGLLACVLFASAAAQGDQTGFGVGVDLRNQPDLIVVDIDPSAPARSGMISHTRLTPSILFSIRATPSVFIESSFGIHATGSKEETPTGTEESGAAHLIFGAGMIYVLSPDQFVSFMLHPAFDIHLLGAVTETTTTKTEDSAMAFTLAMGVGGIMNIKDAAFITVEARVALHSIGDVDEKVNGEEIRAEVDTGASVFSTDMAIGVRFLF